jgi:predicted Zn-dependent protease
MESINRKSGNIALWVVLILAVLLFVYVQSVKSSPCAAPIQYSLGSFDTRFNMGKTEFLAHIESATHVWENAIGKDLFVYDDGKAAKSEGLWSKSKKFLDTYVGKYFVGGPLPVNLIYDSRQESSNQKKVLTDSIDQTKQSADQIRAEFTALQKRYAAAKAEYEILLNNYKARKGDWSTLEAKRLEVNSLADQVNALVQKYNYLVKEVNSVVNVINQTAGQEFEEGIYVRDAKGQRINIYEFGNNAILERVLAHELGHALGLNHNDNPNSIMFYLNNSANRVPTKEDIAALRVICKGE